MQVCTSLQIDNHTRTPPLSFLQAGCPSSRPTNSVITLKATCLLEKKENIRIVNRHLKLTELGSTGPETLHVADRQMKRLAFILNTRKHTITSVVRPTTSCFADWSKRRHVTLRIIDCQGAPLTNKLYYNNCSSIIMRNI